MKATGGKKQKQKNPTQPTKQKTTKQSKTKKQHHNQTL